MRDPMPETQIELPRFSYSVEEAAKMFGVSRSHIFKLMRTGELRRSKIGSKTVVHRDEVARFAAALAGGGAHGEAA